MLIIVGKIIIFSKIEVVKIFILKLLIYCFIIGIIIMSLKKL